MLIIWSSVVKNIFNSK